MLACATTAARASRAGASGRGLPCGTVSNTTEAPRTEAPEVWGVGLRFDFLAGLRPGKPPVIDEDAVCAG